MSKLRRHQPYDHPFLPFHPISSTVSFQCIEVVDGPVLYTAIPRLNMSDPFNRHRFDEDHQYVAFVATLAFDFGMAPSMGFGHTDIHTNYVTYSSMFKST